MNVSHCGGCHLTFSSLSAFDRHQRSGSCLEPAAAGLVAVRKPYGDLWAFPARPGAPHPYAQSLDVWEP